MKIKCDTCGFLYTDNLMKCPMCEFLNSLSEMHEPVDFIKRDFAFLNTAFTQEIHDPDDIPMQDAEFSDNEGELLSI